VTTGTEFGLLGQLVVRRGQAEVAIPAGKQRALLAALLLRANQVVPAGELAGALWGPATPRSAEASLRNHVRRLRKTLGDADHQRISTTAGGYMITASAAELDIAKFGALAAAGHQAVRAGQWDSAAAQLSAALALWRGQPLADVQSDTLAQRELPYLLEQRLLATEARIEADIRLGRNAEVIAELRQLTVAEPLRERPYGLLMLALYRNGQSADALAAYQAARAVLTAQLGIEPGPQLRELQQQILAGDPCLATEGIQPTETAGPAGAPEPRMVPRQLPAAVACFTGRHAEMTALTSLLAPGLGAVATPAMVISAIGGTAGVGKTALAVQWAHQVAERFPDGQLYANLRGYDPDQPVAPADALAGFLRALGVPGQDIPGEMEERAGLYRSRLAGRRILVLLDNARDGDQVRLLLPGDPGCVAVVTSRDALAGLVATDGARRLDLDVLPPADAVALLRSLIGPRADDDPQSTAALAGLCARLPLALRIAAELAAARPSVALAELVAELAASRLDGLDAGEDQADVRAVFSWSFRRLPGDVAEAFALIGLHPGADLDVHAAAALTGTTPGQARRVLGRLHRASLIQAAGPGRYGLHDLLRTYAQELASARDTRGQCDQALTGLFDYYLAAAAAAMDILFPAEAHQRPRITATAAALPEMPGEADARAWLDRERVNLVAVVVYCAGHGWLRHVADLAGTLVRYLISGSHLAEALAVYGHALQAARRSGDVAAEASALHGLGGIGMMNGRSRDAVGHFQAALESYRRCGDRDGQARVLHNLGVIERRLRNSRAAASYYREAMAAYEDAADRLGMAGALCSLAGLETELGSFGRASEHLRLALAVFRAEKDQLREAQALSWMGDVSLGRGELTQAAGFFEQALALYCHVDYPDGIADGLHNLGKVSLRQGEYQRAIGYQRQALALYRKTGFQYGEARTLRSLAAALHGAGQPADARAGLQTALRLAAETGNTHEQANAHRDLAESHHCAGQNEQARHHWQQALDLYTQLGAPEADQIRSRLSAQEAEQAEPRGRSGRRLAAVADRRQRAERDDLRC
jgi:DNA-binding SARP family transcriptional activator